MVERYDNLKINQFENINFFTHSNQTLNTIHQTQQCKTEKKTTNLKLSIERNLLLKIKANRNLPIKRNHLMVMIVNPLIKRNRFLKVRTNKNLLTEKNLVQHALP